MTCASVVVPAPRAARRGGAAPPTRAAGPPTGEPIPCRDGDPELWFSSSPAHLERAKDLCRPCPWKVECLAGAVARAEPWGVWGGEIFQDGVTVPRKRSRGRPRKGEQAA